MERIKVVDIMTRTPITIPPSINLLECAKKMVRKKVGSLIIVEGKKLLGFISEKDVLWAIIKKSNRDLSKIKAIDISPRKIVTVRPDNSIRETIEKMKKTRFERLPVIQSGELVGMITVKDILNFHPEIYPELEEFGRIREEAKKLRRIKETKKSREGVCEECGNQEILYEVDGVFVCETCGESK